MARAKVYIANRQKKTKIPTGARLLIKRCCNAVLAYEKVEFPAEISVSFTDDERILQPACTELAYALQHQSKGSVSFAEMNGESLKERNEYRRLLHAAGFVDSPQGMKLYG